MLIGVPDISTLLTAARPCFTVYDEFTYKPLENKYILPKRFDSSFWCGVSQTLVKNLCRLWNSVDYALPSERKKLQEAMVNKFLDVAVQAQQEMMISLDKKENFDNVSFESGLHSHIGTRDKFFLSGSLQDALNAVGSSESFYLENVWFPKGLHAAIVEKQAYLDSLVVGLLEPQVDQLRVPLEVEGKYVMVEQTGVGELGSFPRSIASAKRNGSKLNKTWYVVWQIAYPVHMFAEHWLGGTSYSLELLCERLGIAENLLEVAIDMTPDNDDESIEKEVKRLVRRISPPPSRPAGNDKRKMESANRSRKKQKTKDGRSNSNSDKKKRKSKKDSEGSMRGKAPIAKLLVIPPDAPIMKKVPACKYWPEGWKQETYERKSGASKGDTDDYWYSPMPNRHKFRSGKEIQRYLQFLDEFDGDFSLAYTAFRRGAV